MRNNSMSAVCLRAGLMAMIHFDKRPNNVIIAILEWQSMIMSP